MTNFIKICWTILTTKYADRQRGVIYFMHLENRKHKKVNKKLYKIPTYENDKNSVSQGIMIYMWKPQRIVQEGWVNYSHMQHACYTLWNIKLFHFLVPACSADISTTGSERTAYITQKQALLESHMYLQVRSRNTQALGKNRKVTSDTEHTINSQRWCNKNGQGNFTACKTCHFNTTRIKGHYWTLPSQWYPLPSSQYTSLWSVLLFVSHPYVDLPNRFSLSGFCMHSLPNLAICPACQHFNFLRSKY